MKYKEIDEVRYFEGDWKKSKPNDSYIIEGVIIGLGVIILGLFIQCGLVPPGL